MQKGDPMVLNFEVLEMQKWNIPTDRASKELCVYLSWLLPALWSLKLLIFCFFLLMSSKISHNLGKIFKCIWENFWSSIRKRYGSLSSEIPLARCQPLKTQGFDIFCWLRFDTAIIYLQILLFKVLTDLSDFPS